MPNKTIKAYVDYYDSENILLVNKEDYDKVFGESSNWDISQDGELYHLEGEDIMDFLRSASNVFIHMNPSQN